MHINTLYRFCVVRIPLLGILLLPAAAPAQSTADCLACHSDGSLTMTKKGKTVSLFVDEKKFSGSAHGALECVACHAGFSPTDLPHAKKIRPVDCTSCHSDQTFKNYGASVHGKSRPGARPAAACTECH